MVRPAAGILATGSYLPKDEVTSADLAQRIHQPAFLRRRCGIGSNQREQRRHEHEGQRKVDHHARRRTNAECPDGHDVARGQR